MRDRNIKRYFKILLQNDLFYVQTQIPDKCRSIVLYVELLQLPIRPSLESGPVADGSAPGVRDSAFMAWLHHQMSSRDDEMRT